MGAEQQQPEGEEHSSVLQGPGSACLGPGCDPPESGTHAPECRHCAPQKRQLAQQRQQQRRQWRAQHRQPGRLLHARDDGIGWARRLAVACAALLAASASTAVATDAYAYCLPENYSKSPVDLGDQCPMCTDVAGSLGCTVRRPTMR